jgi:hypothetical protein
MRVVYLLVLVAAIAAAVLAQNPAFVPLTPRLSNL